MSDRVQMWLEAVAIALEVAGALVIVVGAIAATAMFLSAALRSATRAGSYRGYRGNLGRAILLGLEFLVAGDIIDTISVEPSLENVTALGLIVLIRTFLSFSLATEIEGTLPWRRRAAT